MPRWNPPSLGDFVRRIAFDYVRYGYYRYAVRTIPQGKDLPALDDKLRRAYGVTSSRVKRHRDRRKSLAVVEYLRYHHTFILLATEGRSDSFDRIRSYDLRTAPIHLLGYSIGIRGGEVNIQIARDEWRRREQRLLRSSLWKKDEIEAALATLPYGNFPGVIRQKLELVAAINKRRKSAGLQEITLPLPANRYSLYRNAKEAPASALSP